MTNNKRLFMWHVKLFAYKHVVDAAREGEREKSGDQK